MKKANDSKKGPKKIEKPKDAGELRKPSKLKPLKEKEKKNWKSNLDDDDDDFSMEDDVKFNPGFDHEEEEEEDDGFYDDNF